jgi:hypothetical protein
MSGATGRSSWYFRPVDERLREQLTIVNAFAHDIATGTWLSCLAVIALVEHEARSPEWTIAAHLVPPLARKLMFLSWASLSVILATGVVRMVTWKVYGWTGDVEASRTHLLKVKHALLGLAVVAGTAWQAYIVYR